MSITNRRIAIAHARLCHAKQHAALTEAHTAAQRHATLRYLDDLMAIGSADLQDIRTLRYDHDMAALEASYSAARQKAAATALKRAIDVLDVKPNMSPAAVAARAAFGQSIPEDMMGYVTDKGDKP